MRSEFYNRIRELITQRELRKRFSGTKVSKIRQRSIVISSESIYETAKALNNY